jgi:hypothetical protein
MCVAPEQVVDELASNGFLSTNQLATRFGMAVCKRRHRVVHYLQHRPCRRSDRPVVALPDDRWKLGPHAAGRGQGEVDTSPATRSSHSSSSTGN